nr:hypothetical protein [Sodalis glossinidius]
MVDYAPSDLDTLNKLAQAISNNPKFAESVTQLLSQKLAKNENGADIPDKNQFVKNIGLTETVDCAKNALDKRTGGTVNGDIISQCGQLLLKGDNHKHLGFHNQDGSVRMCLYKDKGGDGVRLNNGNDGGRDWVFNKNGHFYSPPQALHAAVETYQENGNIHGAVWGGHLSGWVDNRVNGRATWDYVNGTFVRDIRGGLESVIAWNGPGYVDQGGYVLTGAALLNKSELVTTPP